MQPQAQQKELPSVELSLKFMAWDLKQIKEIFLELNNNLKTFIGMSRARSMPLNESPPF